jgi:3-oxoacyl-(acyl-carrier-protein) synthase
MKNAGVAAIICAVLINPASARVSAPAAGIDLDTYTCKQFLADVAAPNDGAKLLRTMMAISWATGYAAAHQTGTPRADSRALQLISTSLGGACQKNQFATIVTATKKLIEDVVQKK